MPFRLHLHLPVRAKQIPLKGSGVPLDAAYYQVLHEQSRGYQRNNWLADDAELLAADARSIIELGCGNGRFLVQALGHFETVCGCDWALSPLLLRTLTRHPSLRFLKLNLIEDALPGGFDLACSGDLLEHLPTTCLDAVLPKLDGCAAMAYHKIACFDDGHAHLSILPPEEWLERFRRIDPGYVLRVDESRGADRRVAVITKGFGGRHGA
jgi:SAM-dependent methyltransferase